MDDQRKELRKLIAQLRLVQGVRSTTREYRNLDEQNDARTVLEASGLQFTNLYHRGERRDPPDCEVEIDGFHCGIELTEFVHRQQYIGWNACPQGTLSRDHLSKLNFND
jgi:hypothetical protein